jgi:hypothetical protein
LLLTFSHSRNVVVLGYFVAAFSLAFLLYLQLTLRTGSRPDATGQHSNRRWLGYSVLVLGLIVQLSGAMFHSSGMSILGSSLALFGFVSLLWMSVASRIGNYQAPDQSK